MMFGEKYNWSGGSFCFDEALDNKGPCKMPVEPQDSRPIDDPGTYPQGDGGTVTGPGSSTMKTFSNETRITGVGDFVKALTSALGIRPCAGCERRAERLNKLIPFHSRRDR